MASTAELEAEILAEMEANPEAYADVSPVNDTITIDPETRTINLPASETLFGTEQEMDVERKYFKCPRIVGDNIDLSKHQIYITYVTAKDNTGTFLPEEEPGLYYCEDMAVDETGDYITFSWLLSGNVLSNPGFIAFAVVAKRMDGDVLKTRWKTKPAVGTVLLTVPDGAGKIADAYPDIIAQLLNRMESVEAIATPEAMQGYVEKYLGEHPVQLDETLTDNTKAAPAGVVGDVKSGLGELQELVEYRVSPNLYNPENNNAGRLTNTKGEYNDWTSWTSNLFASSSNVLYFSQLPYSYRAWNGNLLVSIGAYSSFVQQPDGTYRLGISQTHDYVAFESANSGTGKIEFDNDFEVSETPITQYEPYGVGNPYIHDERIARYSEIPAIETDDVVRCLVIPDTKISIGLRISNTISVGDSFDTISASYRSVANCSIPKGAIGIYVAGTRDSTYPRYAIVDSQNKVSKIASIDSALTEKNYGYYIDISNVEDAKTLYFECTVSSNSSTVYFVFDNDDFNIYCGDAKEVTFSSAYETMCIENDMPVMVKEFSSSDNTEIITFSETQYCRNVGIWLRLEDFNLVSAIQSITFSLYMDSTLATTQENENPQCLQMGNWIFLKIRTLDCKFNIVKITMNLADTTKTIPLQIGANPIINHFNRPIISIDFDHTWQATADCGAYDDLITNKIPFTITGVVSHEVDTLKAYHKTGLLDVGSYAGGTDGTTIGDTMTFTDIINALEERIDAKVTDGYNTPTSFGGGGHVIPPRLKTALKTCGYTSVKGGTMGGINSVTCKEPEYIYLGCSVDMAMTLGGVYFYFAHGVSTNPSGEDNPSMYDSYTNFTNVLNGIKEHVNGGGALVKNMKQFSEFMSQHNLID